MKYFIIVSAISLLLANGVFANVKIMKAAGKKSCLECHDKGKGKPSDNPAYQSALKKFNKDGTPKK